TGGILLFDIKEPSRRRLTRMSSRIGPDWAVFAEIMEDPAKDRLVRKIVSFRKAGQLYRRVEEIHTLAIYSAQQVSQMLRSVGFQVRTYRAYGNYKLAKDRK